MTADDMQEKSVRVLSHEGKLATYTYPKNRRVPIDAGTRASNVLVSFGGGDHYRRGIARRAIDVAIREWELRWREPFPWDEAEFHVFNYTVQVVVEVRVNPPFRPSVRQAPFGEQDSDDS